MTAKQLEEVTAKAKAMRRHILRMITAAQSGHPGGSLSAADMLAVLYFAEMKVNAAKPNDPKRDRFVLSKGHAAPVLYAALAEKGFFPVEELSGLRQINRMLQGHPDMKGTPGVDMTTGSLGQGISAACGMALAGRIDRADYRVYTLLGDGELEEGQVWEAAMFAAHHQLGNLTALIDYNGLQIDGKLTDVMSPLPIAEKWRAFNWHVLEIDGHDPQAIYGALQTAKAKLEQPTAIVATTTKGKGVSGMEDQADWHGKAPSQEECERFLRELEGEKA